jgi:rhomboid protease GluP
MPLVEVFRAPRQVTCEQRAFVLHAVGIPSEILPYDNAFLLFVDSDAEQTARHHLESYRLENRPAAKTKPQPVLHDHAWITPVLYLVVLVIAGRLATLNLFGFDWYSAGAMRGNVAHSGDWYQLFTALTLHVDPPHLFGNLLFGGFFSYLAARLLGPGIAWASIVGAAVCGNLLDSLLMPSIHVSIGASTAVFATLGLVAAYSWRMQLGGKGRRLYHWAHRWAPLISGIMLLGLIGAGGENTDVLAHLTGFFCGVVLGVIYAHLAPTSFAKTLLQIAAGVIATVAMIGAWLVAGLHAHSSL